MVIPIEQSLEGDTVGAVMVIGLNCRLPFDQEYQDFVNDLTITLGTQFAAVRSQELELKRKEGIAAVERAKHLLLSNVSHELLSPLSLISGPMDEALEGMEEGENRESINLARRQVFRLNRLINMITEMNSFEAGGLKGSFGRVNLGEVTRDLSVMLRSSAESAGIQYTIECDTTANEVYIDRDRYERIVSIVVGNALRFTGLETVKVSLRYEDDDAILTVEDTGVGIPERLLEILNAADKEENAGSGISLSYVKVRDHMRHIY